MRSRLKRTKLLLLSRRINRIRRRVNMDITDLRTGLESVLDRFSALEERLNSVQNAAAVKRTNSNLLGLDRKGTPENLKQRFALQVSSVVGLKETILWPRRSMRYMWALLLCTGLFGTFYYIYKNTSEYMENPTATIVKFIKQDEYQYPPLVLCPGTWLNAEKAFSLGLSVDALKYSLAYADLYSVDPSINVSRGKREFLQFFESRNYQRLLDYYNDISIDIVAEESTHRLASSYRCYGCVNGSGPLEKVFIDGMICYVVQFQPDSAKHYLVWSGFAPQVQVKIEDLTAGVVKATTNWKVYLMKDKYLVQPNFPPIAVAPYTVTNLKFYAQKFFTLNSDKSPCLEMHKIKQGYSSARCAIKCLHNLYKAVFDCHLFPYYSRKHDHPPISNFCNYLDPINGRNVTHFDLWTGSGEVTPMETDDAEVCVHSCPHTCNRTIFTSTMDSQYPIVVDPYDSGHNILSQSVSKVIILVDNTADELGGILSETEVVTLSFAGFISNIGGTLSLFLGCTFMTIFQIVLSIIDYLCTKRNKKIANGQVQTKPNV